MANMHLVTGYAGQKHVKAADHGAFNTALLGSGQFVLGKGNRFSATVISNNLIRVADGDIYMQGRHIRLDEGTYVDLAIENGAQGVKRNDLIVARYSRNSATAVEEVNLVVIKGTAAASNPVDPSYTSGDIIEDHAEINDLPLYRVPIDGLNVGSLVPLFNVFEQTVPEIYDLVVANKKATDTSISNHTKNSSNPHGVTAAQVGTYTSEQIDAKVGYNKAESISSVTKTIFGLGSAAVPDDVFKFLGKYNQHWWRTLAASGQWTISRADLVDKQITYIKTSSHPNSFSIQYADSVALDASNKLALSGTVSSLTVTPGGDVVSQLNQLRTKYFIHQNLFYYNPGGAAYSERTGSSGDYTTRYYLPCQEVQAYYATSGEINYVYSTNRNAYPDSGTSNGLKYWYLGIPFDNAAKAPKSATGTYVGSGTYGSGSPNKIQLDFKPRFAIVVKNAASAAANSGLAGLFSIAMIWVEGQTEYGDANSPVTISASGNSLAWYAGNASYQLNTSGTTYCYYVCG